MARNNYLIALGGIALAESSTSSGKHVAEKEVFPSLAAAGEQPDSEEDGQSKTVKRAAKLRRWRVAGTERLAQKNAEVIMNESRHGPQAEDVISTGTRVSWGAILAGVFLALGIYFLLGTIGAATGLTLNHSTLSLTARTAVILWGIGTTLVALFVGGLITSLYTVGENKTEAVLSGIIMWAVLYCVILALGVAGIRAGNTSLTLSQETPSGSTMQSWEIAARAAGVPAEEIENWRRKAANPAAGDDESRKELAKRMGWYAFAGTWLSMLAAAAGAYLGAGPTFRLVTVRNMNSAALLGGRP